MKKILTISFIALAVTTYSQSKSEETKTIESVVNGALKYLSSKDGTQRDWAIFKNFFLPHASFTVLFQNDSSSSFRNIPLEEFIRIIGNQAFEEYEIAHTIDEYNGIAQVFQSYKVISDKKEEMGMNSYQLIYHNNRWWISNILWTNDSNGVKVPDKYLKH